MTEATQKIPTGVEIRKLVERGQKGDRTALEELYLIHFDRIYSYLHMTVGNRHDAEDLTTQTFLRMLESIGKFRFQTAPFSAWLFRIAHTLSMDHFRANLCDGTWAAARAKARASELLVPLSPHPVIVMLGRKVTEAMRRAAMIDEEIVPFATRSCCPGITLVSLPHPSGRNAAMWNPQARERARQILRDLVPTLPWGSIESEEVAA